MTYREQAQIASSLASPSPSPDPSSFSPSSSFFTPESPFSASAVAASSSSSEASALTFSADFLAAPRLAGVARFLAGVPSASDSSSSESSFLVFRFRPALDRGVEVALPPLPRLAGVAGALAPSPPSSRSTTLPLTRAYFLVDSMSFLNFC